MKRLITRLAITALFAALISAGAFITIPIGPVPIILQNMFTLLSGLVLGPALGTSSVWLFIAAGAVGLPVFSSSGSPAGFARIIGPTGGYIMGYVVGAFVAGFIAGVPRPGEKLPVWRLALAAAMGILMVYVPGLYRLKMYLETTWPQTIAAGFVPFIAGDIIKGVIVCLITPRLRRVASELL